MTGSLLVQCIDRPGATPTHRTGLGAKGQSRTPEPNWECPGGTGNGGLVDVPLTTTVARLLQ